MRAAYNKLETIETNINEAKSKRNERKKRRQEKQEIMAYQRPQTTLESSHLISPLKPPCCGSGARRRGFQKTAANTFDFSD